VRRISPRELPALAGRDVSVLIWTTTPWTIPSNLAIAFHPEFDYAAYDVDGRAVIVAEGAARDGRADVKRRSAAVARMKGETLEGIRFRHPLYDARLGRRAGDYVTLEQGTGAVHTAPGHGADDFLTGRSTAWTSTRRSDRRHFLDTVELFGGQRVFDANPRSSRRCTSAGAVASRDVLAPVPTLLALPQPGDLPRHVAVVRSP
jgi:isoleucyl-tRNA synthetase